MNQDNHEATDVPHKLAPRHAGLIRKALEAFGFADKGEAQSDTMDRLGNIEDESDDALDLTPEQAKLASDFLKKSGDEHEHTDSLRHLDAVANQHGSYGALTGDQTANDIAGSDGSDGKAVVDPDAAGESGDAGGEGGLNTESGTHGGGPNKTDVGEA